MAIPALTAWCRGRGCWCCCGSTAIHALPAWYRDRSRGCWCCCIAIPALPAWCTGRGKGAGIGCRVRAHSASSCWTYMSRRERSSASGVPAHGREEHAFEQMLTPCFSLAYNTRRYPTSGLCVCLQHSRPGRVQDCPCARFPCTILTIVGDSRRGAEGGNMSRLCLVAV